MPGARFPLIAALAALPLLTGVAAAAPVSAAQVAARDGAVVAGAGAGHAAATGATAAAPARTANAGWEDTTAANTEAQKAEAANRVTPNAAADPATADNKATNPRARGAAAADENAADKGTAGTNASPAPAARPPVAEYLGTYVWRDSDEDFGGFSGIELSADGRSYTALSDRGTIRWGSIDRDRQGRIAGLTTAGRARLQDSEGGKLAPGYLGDAEGIAIDAQGRVFVSFEGLDRIARFDDPDGPAVRLPSAKAFSSLRRNQGLEALALTPGGDLLTVPEYWARADRGFPVFRLRDATGAGAQGGPSAWDNPFEIPRDGDWAPVGADVGPDGKLYLLERRFRGLRGFASRVRRFALDGDRLGPPQTLLESSLMQYDNLEGIAVWRDQQGVRLTMISDDNFFVLQRTELVEYRIRD